MTSTLAFKPNAADPVTRFMQCVLYAYAGKVDPLWDELSYKMAMPRLRQHVESGAPFGPTLPLKLLEGMQLSPGVLKGTHAFSRRPVLQGRDTLPLFCVKGDVRSGELLTRWFIIIDSHRKPADRMLPEEALHRLLPAVLETPEQAAEVLLGQRPLPFRALVLLCDYLNLCGGGAAHDLLVQLLHGATGNPPRLNVIQPLTNLLEGLKRLPGLSLPSTARIKQSGANTHTPFIRNDAGDDDDEEGDAVGPPPTDEAAAADVVFAGEEVVVEAAPETVPSAEPPQPKARRQRATRSPPPKPAAKPKAAPKPQPKPKAKAAPGQKAAAVFAVPVGLDVSPTRQPLEWLDKVVNATVPNREAFGRMLRHEALVGETKLKDFHAVMFEEGAIKGGVGTTSNLLNGRLAWNEGRLKVALDFIKCTPAQAVSAVQKRHAGKKNVRLKA